MVERIIYDFLEYWVPVSMLVMGGIVVIMETAGGMRAAYGRYNKSNLGLRAPIAWFFQESPAFIVPLLICIYRRPFLFDILGRLNTNTILLGFFMFHYFHRSFIYTLRIKSDKRVNYMENIMAFIFCIVNGLQIGHYHTFYPNNALSNWNFWLGSVLFWVGLIINIDSDYRLIRLRSSTTPKSTTSSPSKSAYKIPQGGLFEYVSAANYSGECLEWLGFALASWSLPGLAFSWFTFSNIGPRAYHHHLYYKELFGAKYPKNRKALIPFLL